MNQQPPGRPPTPRPHDYLRDDDLHTVKRYYLRLQRATIAAIVTFFAIALVTEFTNHSLHQRFVLLTSAMACCSITAWLSWTIQRLLRTLMLFATLGIVLRNPPAAPHYLDRALRLRRGPRSVDRLP